MKRELVAARSDWHGTLGLDILQRGRLLPAARAVYSGRVRSGTERLGLADQTEQRPASCSRPSEVTRAVGTGTWRRECRDGTTRPDSRMARADSIRSTYRIVELAALMIPTNAAGTAVPPPRVELVSLLEGADLGL